jgi:hypothetical protein
MAGGRVKDFNFDVMIESPDHIGYCLGRHIRVARQATMNGRSIDSKLRGQARLSSQTGLKLSIVGFPYLPLNLTGQTEEHLTSSVGCSAGLQDCLL